jgi:hypothetical protein
MLCAAREVSGADGAGCACFCWVTVSEAPPAVPCRGVARERGSCSWVMRSSLLLRAAISPRMRSSWFISMTRPEARCTDFILGCGGAGFDGSPPRNRLLEEKLIQAPGAVYLLALGAADTKVHDNTLLPTILDFGQIETRLISNSKSDLSLAQGD